MSINRLEPGILARIKKRVVINDITKCHEWIGATAGAGEGNLYGQIHIWYKNKRVHRVVWELHNGPIPQGLLVLHKCDNPKCCNIEHLFLGTQHDNMIDMVDKGRDIKKEQKGESNNNSKLGYYEALFIKYSPESGRAMENKYGVSSGTVSQIRSGKLWGHLP